MIPDDEAINVDQVNTSASELPQWALEMAEVSDQDKLLPATLDGVNLALNRVRLAAFLSRFAQDRDLRDLLALDLLGEATDLPLSSTGVAGVTESLTIRPFRIWEYVWLYKCLGLSAGGLKVLDLGGPASHLSILAAIAGCRVTSVDINGEIVEAGRACARGFGLASLEHRVGDMRDLSAFSDGEFDAVLSCSVVEHLTAEDQEEALREAARVLRPGGMVGLTFDFGEGAPGGNEHLPPPHAPAPNAHDALQRYKQGGLVEIGNPFSEDPIPGSLFHHPVIKYTVASLFLAKAPAPEHRPPQCEIGGSVLQRLSIPELPYQVYRHFTSIALMDGLPSQDAGVSQRDNERRPAAVMVARERITALEHAATERLAAMNERDEVITGLVGELDTLREAADLREKQLNDAVSTIGAQQERAAKLEQAAAERLAEMHEKDHLISQLAAELQSRASAIEQLRQKLEEPQK